MYILSHFDHKQKLALLEIISKCFISIYFNRNIRRCLNSTGRLSTNGTTSPPIINRTVPPTPTGVLTTASRPSQPPPTVVHHRGAYYSILRPTSRRTDVC